MNINFNNSQTSSYRVLQPRAAMLFVCVGLLHVCVRNDRTVCVFSVSDY